MNKAPSYHELLETNYHLKERCQNLENIIQEQNLLIEEYLTASTLYRELYLKLEYGIKE